MSRFKSAFFPGFAALLCWGLDQWSKSIAVQGGMSSYGILSFHTQFNHGLMLGLYSELPPTLRVVGLSTLGAFLIFCAVVLLYFLPARLLSLRISIGMVLGGILGNISDRAALGAVVDFISVSFASRVAFNLADLFQWIAYAIILANLILHYDELWPSLERRDRYLVDSKLQLGFALKVFVASLCFGVTLGTLAYTYFKLTIASPELFKPEFRQQALASFAWISVWVTLGFSAFLFFLTVVSLHRVTGPVHAFKRHVHALLRGERSRLKLRERDHFKELETLASRLDRYADGRSRRGKPKGRRSA